MADHYSIHYVPTVRGAVIGFDHFTRDTEYVAVALESLDVLDGRNRKGDRDRTHFHFLRGLLYCAECKEAGRDRRLV